MTNDDFTVADVLEQRPRVRFQRFPHLAKTGEYHRRLASDTPALTIVIPADGRLVATRVGTLDELNALLDGFSDRQLAALDELYAAFGLTGEERQED